MYFLRETCLWDWTHPSPPLPQSRSDNKKGGGGVYGIKVVSDGYTLLPDDDIRPQPLWVTDLKVYPGLQGTYLHYWVWVQFDP